MIALRVSSFDRLRDDSPFVGGQATACRDHGHERDVQLCDRLAYVTGSRAAAASLAENYVGFPIDA
jgi:hypothetical protein